MVEITDYLKNHWAEVAGTILSIIYLYLSIKQKVSLWIFGFLCSALYIYVFFVSKFYADMSLQFYYLGVSVYGWISWKMGKQKSGAELPVKHTSGKQGLVLLIVVLTIYLVYYYILSGFTDSPLPKADSLTTALSIVATWMLAKKLIEQWLLWIFIDGLSSGLYFYKGLNLTGVLFIIYTIMAVVGYVQWLKSMRQRQRF
ncbi:MAG: nicotinamide riboside transporter PnuC [Paludibacter sp.]|nr:nicotinamide riboside transporter PnuC [Paludibacter sp.]